VTYFELTRKPCSHARPVNPDCWTQFRQRFDRMESKIILGNLVRNGYQKVNDLVSNRFAISFLLSFAAVMDIFKIWKGKHSEEISRHNLMLRR